MTAVTDEQRNEFFSDVRAASQKAIWCAIATVAGGEPRVRMVHPTWEGETLLFATSTGSPKRKQIEIQPTVDVQFQVAPPDFIHILVRGTAKLIEDPAEKKRIWDVIDYDLSAFWSGGPEDPEYSPVAIHPTRIEHSKMFGSMDKRVWRSR